MEETRVEPAANGTGVAKTTAPAGAAGGVRLGRLAAGLLAFEALTGLGLMFCYRPTVDAAWLDLVDLREVSRLGALRGLHRWGAHAAVLVVWLHLLRTAARGVYAPPRRANWGVGAALLLLTLLLAVSGYLLPWDQVAYWGIATLSPSLAPDTAPLGGAQLLAAYVLHAMVLPLAAAALTLDHLRRARRDTAAVAGEAPAARFASSADAIAATAVLLLLAAAAWLYPPDLGAPADPSARPDFVAVPWFLGGLQELSFYFHPWVAYAAVPALLLAGLLGLPWLAQGGDGGGRGVRGLFLGGWLFLWLWPMAVGGLLGPWPTRPAAPAPRALSEIFWSGWLGTLEPAGWWLRELPGILLLGAYFVALPLVLTRWQKTRGAFAAAIESLGPWRFYAAAGWLLALALVPLKMASRWLFDVGAWIHLPELSFYL